MSRTKTKYIKALLSVSALTAIATISAKPAEAISIGSVTTASDYSSSLDISGNSSIAGLGGRLIDFNSAPFGSPNSPVDSTVVFPGTNQRVTFSGDGTVVSRPDVSGRYAAPAANAAGDGTPSNGVDDTPYLALGASQEPGPVKLSFKRPFVSTFGFLWGSVDTYNSVSFGRGNATQTFSGQDIANFIGGIANGNQGSNNTFFVNFIADNEADYFDSVTFRSDFGSVDNPQAAFEIDDIRYTEVPTPALLPGLVGMGVAALRKRKQVGEAQEA